MEPEDTTAVVGSTALLRCRSSESNPKADITWTKDRQPLTSDVVHTFLSPLGNLYIVGVEPGDAGLYQCTATNPVTGRERHSSEVQLTVVGEWAGWVGDG